MKKAFSSNVLRMIYFLYAIMMLSIIMTCLFFSDIDYARKVSVLPNCFLILLGSCFLAVLYKRLRSLKGESNDKRNIMLFLFFSIIFLLIQIVLVHSYYFKTDWDVSTIIDGAMLIAQGQELDGWYQYYFSMAPNNLLLVYIYSVIIKVFIFIGWESHSYFALIVFQCFINWLTGVLFFFTALNFRKNYVFASFAYILYVLMVGLSPWVSIPYSDSVALVFPIAVLFLYSKHFHRRRLELGKWFFIAAFSYVGYKIKPQALIVTISIGIITILTGFSNRKILEYKNKIVSFICGIIFSFILVNSIFAAIPIDIDKNGAFGAAHYLMLGLNTKSMGVWIQEDVDYSDSFSTAAERSKMNLLMVKQRLENMGISGFIEQIHRKTLTNYNDGTFCWGGEGTFYYELMEEKSILSPLLRNIYYNRDHMGKYYPIWSNFEQMLWMTVLVLSMFVLFSCNVDQNVAVTLLSVIGLTIFEALFEARARYLFIYIPFYILLAVIGIEILYDRVIIKIRKEADEKIQ